MRKITVGDLMTDEVLSCRERDDLATVYDRMDAAGIRHLPVVNNEKELIGLISQRDLLRSGLFEGSLAQSDLHDQLRQRNAGELMVRDPATVTEDQDIDDVADLMLVNKFGGLPVVEGTRLVGILTEADFVRYVRDSVRAERSAA